MSGAPYSQEEDATLRAFAPLGVVRVRQEMKRSSSSIRHRAKRLGIEMGPSPMGNRVGTRWRGKLVVPQNAHPIVCRVFRELNSQWASIGETSRKAGIDKAVMTSWRRTIQPKLGDIIAVLNVLGLDLRVVRIKE